VVLLLLFGITVVGVALAGYAGGMEERRTRVPVYAMGLLLCGVIFVILDLDRPNVGLITISQQPMIDVLASMSAYSD